MRQPVSIDHRKHTQEQLEQIQLRAYELYAARGHKDGHDVEDWLEAESEVLAAGPLSRQA